MKHQLNSSGIYVTATFTNGASHNLENCIVRNKAIVFIKIGSGKDVYKRLKAQESDLFADKTFVLLVALSDNKGIHAVLEERIHNVLQQFRINLGIRRVGSFVPEFPRELYEFNPDIINEVEQICKGFTGYVTTRGINFENIDTCEYTQIKKCHNLSIQQKKQLREVVNNY